MATGIQSGFVLSGTVLRSKFPCDMAFVRLKLGCCTHCRCAEEVALASDYRKATDEPFMNPNVTNPKVVRPQPWPDFEESCLNPRHTIGGRMPSWGVKSQAPTSVVGSALAKCHAAEKAAPASKAKKAPCCLFAFLFFTTHNTVGPTPML